jgi:hypothetical protein
MWGASMTTQLRPHEAMGYRNGSGAETAWDLEVLSAFATVPSVKFLSITDRPSGVLVYLALDDLQHEERAYETLSLLQREMGDIPIKLVALSPDEYGRLIFSSDARRYAY